MTVNNDRTLVGEGGGEEVRDEVGYREAPAPKTFADDRPERSLWGPWVGWRQETEDCWRPDLQSVRHTNYYRYLQGFENCIMLVQSIVNIKYFWFLINVSSLVFKFLILFSFTYLWKICKDNFLHVLSQILLEQVWQAQQGLTYKTENPSIRTDSSTYKPGAKTGKKKKTTLASLTSTN